MKNKKKYLVLLGLVLLTVLLAVTVRNLVELIDAFAVTSSATPVSKPIPEKKRPVAETAIEDGQYEVFSGEKLAGRFETYEEALSFAQSREESFIRQKDKSRWLWDNYPPYDVYTGNESYVEFETFAEAVTFAKAQKNAFILYRKDNSVIWNSDTIPKGFAKIDAPHVSQLPELPRGCEVTSLTMLLLHKGISVDKLTLAEQITKDRTPYEIIDGKIHYGNPNNGFVGDIYSLRVPGLGVYHRPVHALMSQFLPYASLDLTGCDFDDLLYFLEAGTPVWVIINSTYAALPSSAFEAWHTESGIIQITYKEHSVLVTGYDDQFIYFNNPLGGTDKATRSGFQAAWEQMGHQAITSTP